MKGKKIILIINILIISITLMSCTTGSRELDKLGIIMSTGIDLIDGKVLVTNEVMMPISKPSEDNNSNHVIYLQHEGDTIFEAFRNATLTFDRRLLLSHNRVLIFGEEFAKRGVGDYINFFLYDAEPRETSYLLVAKGSKAYEVMGINEGLSDAPGKYLESLVDNNIHTSKTRSLTMNEYLKYYFQRKTPVLGVVEKQVKRIVNKERGQEEGYQRDVLNVEGGAAFYEDKLVGYYTGEEMMGFNFIIDEIKGGIIVFEVPDKYIAPDVKYQATKGKYTSLEIRSSSTKNEIKIIDGKIKLTINVNLKGAIGEETKGLRLIELDVKNAIEEACSNKVKEYISMVMDKAQKEFKVDSFGIDALFHRTYPELWKEVSDEWSSVFSEIEYTVNVNTNILRTGLIDIPINIDKGEANEY
jgi:spore germination protein KC